MKPINNTSLTFSINSFFPEFQFEMKCEGMLLRGCFKGLLKENYKNNNKNNENNKNNNKLAGSDDRSKNKKECKTGDKDCKKKKRKNKKKSKNKKIKRNHITLEEKREKIEKNAFFSDYLEENREKPKKITIENISLSPKCKSAQFFKTKSSSFLNGTSGENEEEEEDDVCFEINLRQCASIATSLVCILYYFSVEFYVLYCFFNYFIKFIISIRHLQP